MARFNTDERIRALITGPTRHREVDYPGHSELKIGVRALDDIELDGCRIEAQRKIRDLAKVRGWDPVQTSELDPVLQERFVEREIILRAFCDSDTIGQDKPVPFFANDSELARIGSMGVTDLMNVYLEHQEWCNPNLSLTAEAEKELIEELGKEPSAGLYLTGIEPTTLRRLLISLAKKHCELRTGRSTTSSNSGGTTTGS